MLPFERKHPEASRERKVARTLLKFLFGVIVGIILVVIVGIIAAVAIVSVRSRPVSIPSAATLVIHLEGELPERAPVEFSFGAFGQPSALTMEEVWDMLRRAAADKRIKAVVLEPSGLNIGWGKMQELRTDLDEFKKSGKPLYVYLKTPGTREYYVATAGSQVFMGPEDMLNLKGLRFELMYFKHTLDKLGITVDVQHAGKYKDYGDMFTRSDMSPETKEVLGSVIDDLYADLTRTIAIERKKPLADVTDAINNGPLLSNQALNRGLVDALIYEDQMFGKLKTQIHDDIHKVSEREYVKSSDSDAGIGGKQKIAFVAAEGDIIRGDPESSNSSEGITSESFDRLLNKVSNQSDIKGVIVRIDSPGGESFASDELWRAMNELARKKPTVVSMSDTAASGGYYMAMNGSPIVAYPGTLTGSIGVVFGKPNLHGLYDKLGIDKGIISRGRFATIDSDYTPLDPAESAKLREGIDQDYHDFVQKVADSRKRPFGQIEPVAQGRVWLGDQAKDNGLVDELGGIDRAIQLVKRKASIGANENVSLVIYPAKRSWLDLLMSSDGDSSDSATAEAIARSLGIRSLGIQSPEILPPIFRSSEIRPWLHPGYLRISPWHLTIQ